MCGGLLHCKPFLHAVLTPLPFSSGAVQDHVMKEDQWLMAVNYYMIPLPDFVPSTEAQQSAQCDLIISLDNSSGKDACILNSRCAAVLFQVYRVQRTARFN